MIRHQVETARNIYENYLPFDESEYRFVNKQFAELEAYATNHIEGNPYTLEETRTLLNYGLPAKNKTFAESTEIYNSFNSINLLYDLVNNGSNLTEDLIKEVHSIVTRNTLKDSYCGHYKTVRNWVGNIETSSPEHVPVHMKKLLDWYNQNKDLMDPIQLAVEFKYRFLCIHPFVDGNGRTSRWIMNFILMSSGYHLTVIMDKFRDEYFDVLNKCNKNDVKPLIAFICKMISNSYKMAIDIIEDFHSIG